MRILLSAFLVAVILLVCGCDEVKVVKIGDGPAELTGSDLEGRPITVESLKGRVALLYFWSDACCGDSVKELEQLHRKYLASGLAIVAINGADGRKAMTRFHADNRLTFPFLVDEDRGTLKRYSVFTYPSIYVVDRNSVVREKILGNIRTRELDELLRRQIIQPPQGGGQ